MSEILPVITETARCRKLLSKGLYINHGLPPGKEAAGDGHFWCGKTQTMFGPDHQLCDNDHCRNAARSCYEA
ncbi:MAG: hypothetical protein O2955_05200 [Planctomycetota bacterium]|nr:hypothetical protein [Planctomycetota bacterium]MDA1211890.1 hypothetical protein [Planctomycetota bacterium]